MFGKVVFGVREAPKVNDMLGIDVGCPLDSHVRGVSESEIIKVKAHYNWSMYQL